MADTSGTADSIEPDPDLIEYVLLTGPTIEDLERLVPTVIDLVASDVINVLDAVVLSRPHDQVEVTVEEARDVAGTAQLTSTSGIGLLLSEHDVELAAAVLEPGSAALLLLIEDRWAAQLGTAGRRSGVRVGGGERVTRHRFLKTMRDPLARARHGGMLARPPATTRAVRAGLAIDRAAQVRELIELVRIGLLSFDQYEDQRRRVLDG